MNFDKSGLKTEGINLPIKQHKNSLKFKDWDRANTISLTKEKGNFYVNFFFKKDTPPLKNSGKSIGIDIGYKKLISTSEGAFIGTNLKDIYERISKKKRGSKKYKKLLRYRNNEMRRVINKWDISNVKIIFVEELKGLKDRVFVKNMNKDFKNKSQYALYSNVVQLLERKCEEQGIRMVKVSPEYTSQTCSRCKAIDKYNRCGEKYICSSCGLEIDADYNASINILNRGVYSLSNTEKFFK